ncbi:MAG: SusE domain-containing protein [Prolixibacteraceae bacterium]|nr:SusE domain-containing protein [Prolixibacteraceae bacterium]
MKKIIHPYSLLLFVFLALAGCNETPELTVLRDITFPAEIEVTSSKVVITESNQNDDVLTVKWPAVDYYIGAPVEYTVQFTLPSDTAGALAWSKARSVKAGTDVYTKAFKAKDLNKWALAFGMEANAEGVLVIRVKSYVDRDAFSAPVSIAFTPFVKEDEEPEPEPEPEPTLPSLWVPGDYQGWDPVTAPRIVDRGSGIYEGYIYIPEGGTNEFKFTAQDAWEPMAYGDGGDGVLIEANFEGGNFVAPGQGYYMLTANLETMEYTITKTEWSIIGDATVGGWTTDTPMTYDAAAKVWVVTTDMSMAGSFKFRANNEWIIDFAVDTEGNFLYADHPVLGYTPDLLNLTVPETGNYTITLDLHNPENYNYTLKLN